MPPGDQNRLSRLDILLVEPDPIDASVLTCLLRDQWAPVDIVHEEHPAGALRHLEQNPVRAVLYSVSHTDLDALPAMILQARAKPVIALVTETEPDLMKAAADAVAARVFVKERFLEAYAERFVRAAARYPHTPTVNNPKTRHRTATDRL